MNASPPVRVPLLDLDLLQTLAAIADTGNFSSAAAQVGRTPSAISMQVKKVEELLGRPVFVRDSRTVTPTPDGAFLVDHARQMLAMNRVALSRFVEPEVRGVVRLGAPDDVAERFLPGMLRRFACSHPGITVNVVVDGSHRMIEALGAGDLDMTLVTCDAGFAGTERAEVLLRERLVWAMRRNGCAVCEEPLPISVWEEGCVWRKAGIDGLTAAGRAWRVAFQSAHISGQRAAILADLAVAPIPVSSLGGEIVEVPERFGLPSLGRYALGLLMTDTPAAPVEAAAQHLRDSFSEMAT